MRREKGRFQILSRWIVWLDMRKALAYRLVFDDDVPGELTKEAIASTPGPPHGASDAKLRSRRGVWMSPTEIQMALKLFPFAEKYMEEAMHREARKLIKEMGTISMVDLLGALG
jgi:hypothetical protein